MASIRQRIVDAVVARLDGAGKPAGLAVHRSRGLSIDQDTLPAIVVYLLAQRTQRVGVRGLLTTFISDRRVSEVSKGYAIELQYAGGRIFLKAFRETSPNDPLEIQAQSQLRLAPAAGAGR